MSLPGYWRQIERAKKIKLKALDENGKKIKIKARGFLARRMIYGARALP